MLLARVIGNVWATRKAESLTGVRLLLVRPFSTGKDDAEDVLVAGDPIGAGEGETVLVAFGRAARTVLGSQDIAWQCAVVAIVDDIALDDGATLPDFEPGGARRPGAAAAAAPKRARTRRKAKGDDAEPKS